MADVVNDEAGSGVCLADYRLIYRTVLAQYAALDRNGFPLLAIFPKFDLHFLAPIAFTPLLIALASTRDAWQRFVLGWAAGIFYWFFCAPGSNLSSKSHGGMGVFGSWGIVLVSSAFLKVCISQSSAWLAGPLMRRPYAVPAVAALWTGLERTHATFGFAWLDLGNAGIDMSVPLRVAPYVGVYGVSFIFCMLAAALACVLLRYPRTRLIPLLSACRPAIAARACQKAFRTRRPR